MQVPDQYVHICCLHHTCFRIYFSVTLFDHKECINCSNKGGCHSHYKIIFQAKICIDWSSQSIPNIKSDKKETIQYCKPDCPILWGCNINHVAVCANEKNRRTTRNVCGKGVLHKKLKFTYCRKMVLW